MVKVNLKMRKKKIRGHNRRYIEIENWRKNNLALRLDWLYRDNIGYVKIRTSTWGNLSVINSEIPEPKGKTKQLMLNGLIDIYYSWKIQLEQSGKPFYLKIWLCEPRFLNSQVVCAIGDKIEYYENLFFKPNNAKSFSVNNYGKLSDKLKNFVAEYHLDEDHFRNDEVGDSNSYTSQKDYQESKKWFNKLLKKPHRTVSFEEQLYGFKELYSFKKGELWILGSK
jgi:hypothetical protein